MNWSQYHRQSEQFANQAQLIARHGHTTEAKCLYWKAAWYEMQALEACPAGKQRTLDITAVSVVALLVKADMGGMGAAIYKSLWTPDGLSDRQISDYALQEIREMLQEIAAA